ncbi:MAG TPA: prolipoprotein diacylglyceryl transferase family protein [Gemmatimonadaceae bacterium]
MHPTLFHLGGWALPSHEAFIFLGVVAATVVFWLRAERQGPFDERLLWIVAGTLISGAVGAKLGTGWRYVTVTHDHSLAGILARGGRSIVGGLAGAYVGAVLTKRLVGYRRRTGDLFAPAVAIGMAIGRIGCFLSEQIGTPTTLPWGLRLSDETLRRIPNCPYCVPGVALHPSFLYEIAFHALMFVWLLVYWRPRVTVEGDLFKIYLLAYAVFRFCVEFVRGNPVLWNGLTGSQLFLIPSTLLLAAYFARRFWVDRNPHSPVIAGEVAG